MNKLFMLIILISTSCKTSFSQDTIKYKGKLGHFLLESIELYPDSTFKWTREYDLSWSNYGVYEIKGSNLKLKYKLESLKPTTMTLKDTLNRIDTIIYQRNFLIDNKTIYRLNSSGNKIRWLRNDFFRTRWSWLTFGYRKLIYWRTN